MYFFFLSQPLRGVYVSEEHWRVYVLNFIMEGDALNSVQSIDCLIDCGKCVLSPVWGQLMGQQPEWMGRSVSLTPSALATHPGLSPSPPF